jgi:hypothetical protein
MKDTNTKPVTTVRNEAMKDTNTKLVTTVRNEAMKGTNTKPVTTVRNEAMKGDPITKKKKIIIITYADGLPRQIRKQNFLFFI